MGWGEFFALASPLCWALAIVLFRRSGETMPPFELNLLKNSVALFCMVLTLLGVLLLGAMDSGLNEAVPAGPFLPEFSGWDWFIILGSGALGMAAADTLYLRTLNLVGAGRAGIIGSLLSPFVIVMSAVYLAERLTSWQWAGFALVMTGILVVAIKRYQTEVSAELLRKGLFIGIAAVAMMALGIVMVKPVLEQGPFLWVVTLRLFGGVAAMVLLVAVRHQWRNLLAVYRKPHPWKLTLVACLLSGYVGSLLWLAGYKLIPASEASIYNEAQGGFMVLLAWLILKEPITSRKILGIILTVAGVMVMLLV